MLNRESSIGILATVGFHLLLLLFAYFYVMPQKEQQRAAFIEVTLGEFKSGSPAKQAPKKVDNIKERVNPSEKIIEDEQPVKAETVEQKQAKAEVKPADLAKAKAVDSEEVIKKNDAEEIDPSRKAADKKQEAESSETKADKNDTKKEGEVISGSPKPTVGDTDANAGKGSDQEKSAPYELQWEGDIQRSALVQQLPALTQNFNALVRVRFEVRADGSVGRLIPLKKSGSPEIDQEVQRTIRSWRFSALPSNVPQQAQWGTITFRFVVR
jgi:TonB family protein